MVRRGGRRKTVLRGERRRGNEERKEAERH